MNVIKTSDLLAIATKPEQYPTEGPVEIAFAGRSNVGKSSLLNLLTGRRKLARMSSSPGKTRTINFYSINEDEFRIVDLPGYGYAKVSKSVSENWGNMMEVYLTGRKRLSQVIQLVDIRHKPTKQDVQMYEFLRFYGLAGAVVATKADKISRNSMHKAKSTIKETLGLKTVDEIFPVSALKKTGQDELLDYIFKLVEEGDGNH